jgi:hypothetical protein
MPAGRKDQAHFDAIADAMKAKSRAQRAESLLLTAAERVAAGFLLGAGPQPTAVTAALDRMAEEQIGLARRRPKRGQ